MVVGEGPGKWAAQYLRYQLLVAAAAVPKCPIGKEVRGEIDHSAILDKAIVVFRSKCLKMRLPSNNLNVSQVYLCDFENK